MVSPGQSLKISLKELSSDLGWTLVGAVAPEIPTAQAEFFSKWIDEKEGHRLAYLKNRQRERLDPKAYFPKIQSILCFGLQYFPGWAEGEVKVANYSWGEDYHIVLKKKLEQSARWIQDRLGSFDYRACVDTSPVLEKVLAAQAGIGWQGKNTLLIHPQHGSTLFLGELFTDLPLHHFDLLDPMADHCGTCTRCIEACPTQALQPYQLQLDRCIAYWNLEHRQEFESQTPDFQGWIAGCDICQQACPWNRKLEKIEASPNSFQHLSRELAQTMNWKAATKNKALSYLPTKKWLANLRWLNLLKP